MGSSPHTCTIGSSSFPVPTMYNFPFFVLLTSRGGSDCIGFEFGFAFGSGCNNYDFKKYD